MTTTQEKTKPQVDHTIDKEKERIRDSLFSKNRSMKGKPKGQTDEEWEKARREAQNEYMAKLDKQYLQR